MAEANRAPDSLAMKRPAPRLRLALGLKLLGAANVVAMLGYAIVYAGRGQAATSGFADVLPLVLHGLSQLGVLFVMMGFLAITFPDDMETPSARKVIGVLLLFSNIGTSYVCYEHYELYAATRDTSPNSPHNERVCAYVHYAILAWVVLWGVVYPTAVWLLRLNSWARARAGLLCDATAVLTAVLLLHAHGETRFPPGDRPFAAAFGRPLIAIVGSATFTPRLRHRLHAAALQAGLLDLFVDLGDLRTDDLRRFLTRRSSRANDAPIASGNIEVKSRDSGWVEAVDHTEESSSLPPSDHQSHYTAKIGDNMQPPPGLTMRRPPASVQPESGQGLTSGLPTSSKSPSPFDSSPAGRHASKDSKAS